VIVALSGPTDRVHTPETVVPLSAVLAPQITAATVGTDGFSGVAVGVPPFGVSFGGLFDPAVWETPVSDIATLTIPLDAQPGTYVAAAKGRRDYGGEALNREPTTTIPGWDGHGNAIHALHNCVYDVS
jgi:hypothetical protein